ncbi:MAG: beta-lactamase family protein [Deltaproteobacteria bacterium]|nr:beta-lactamase family protein [Deltaproteobacteria bacterium]
MYYRLLLFLIIISIGCTSSKPVKTSAENPPHPHKTSSNQNSISKKIDAYLEGHKTKYSFMGTVLVEKNDSVIYQKAIGYASVAHNVKNSMDTKFRIGSLTKQFTASAILKLVQNGKLALTDTLDKFIPDYPEGNRITVHHLLTHSSGIQNFTSFREYWKIMKERLTLPEIIKLFKTKPLNFEPGKKFSYSNSGYILLSYIIEKVSSLPWNIYIEKELIKPAGLKNTGFAINQIIVKNLALGYFKSGTGDLRNAFYNDMSIPAGAGAFYSTTGDLCKWVNTVRQGKILDGKYVKLLFTPFLSGYAYGWRILKIDSQLVFTHGGAINGFLSHLFILPDKNICISVLSNNASTKTGKIAFDIHSILMNKPYKIPFMKKEINLPVEKMKKYEGYFITNPGKLKMRVFVKNGALFTQIKGQRPFEMFAEKKHHFFLKHPEVDFVFNFKEEKIISVKTSQGNSETLWLPVPEAK